MKIRLGIIGCGNIGNFIITNMRQKLKEEMQINIFDKDIKKVNRLTENFPNCVKCLNTEEVIQKSDVILESSSVEGCKEILQIIQNYENKNLVIMSIGGVIDEDDIIEKLKLKGIKVYIPSGAIGGIDILEILREQNLLRKIKLITTKPLSTLEDAPFIKKKNITLENLQNPQVIFRGTLQEAIEGFPQNINVAATLSIYSGTKDLEIEIIADPQIDKNIHKIYIDSEIGEIEIKISNRPSPQNPKTSFLAVASCLHTLNKAIEEFYNRL